METRYSKWTSLLDRSLQLSEWALTAACGIMKLIGDVTPRTEANLVHSVLETLYGKR
jgi:hypothetical protein